MENEEADVVTSIYKHSFFFFLLQKELKNSERKNDKSKEKKN